MDELVPTIPNVPLVWPDVILDLPDLLEDIDAEIYIVGGPVRDAYMRRPIQDVDLVTSGSGLKLAKSIANRLNGAFYPLDTERSVGRAIVETPDGRVVFDVSQFRGTDLRSDLEDRDFTLNALAVNLHSDLQHVIDPLGGLDDLKNHLLRRCSPDSIANDPIRVLRAVRQSVQFNLRIEAETLRDVRAVSARLHEPSPERVRDELFKLLALPKAASALRIARAVKILDTLFPEMAEVDSAAWEHTLTTMDRLNEMLVTISPQRTDASAAQFGLGMLVMALDRFRAPLQAHTATVWADERPYRGLVTFTAFCMPLGKDAAERYCVHLRLSNAEKERILTTVQHADAFNALILPAPTDLYRYWKRCGRAGIDVILISLARYLAERGVALEQDAWIALVERARVFLDAYFVQPERFVAPPALVNGNDLMRLLDLPSSPVIGELLEMIREAQVKGDVTTAEDALEMARTYLSRRNSN